METLLAGKTQGAFDQAQLVYEDGGNSKSFAVLSIPGGLPRDVLLGTQLSGRRVDGVIVVGTANDNYSAGDLALEFLYPISDDQEDHLDCRVGGLPENEILERGCKYFFTLVLVVATWTAERCSRSALTHTVFARTQTQAWWRPELSLLIRRRILWAMDTT
jgi:hypothetical protein